MLQALDKQRHFYELSQDRILLLLRRDKDLSYDDKESKGDAQSVFTQNVQDTPTDLHMAVDTFTKTKRVEAKLDLFKTSNSLTDQDMQGKLQGLETLIDDLLDTSASLPDNAELDSRVKEVHLSHRKLTKEVLRATPDKLPT